MATRAAGAAAAAKDAAKDPKDGDESSDSSEDEPLLSRRGKGKGNAADKAKAEAAKAKAAKEKAVKEKEKTKRKAGRPPGAPNKRVKAEKPVKSSSSHFSEVEDWLLTKAYLSVSEDPVKGTDQKGDEFWLNVFQKFKILYDECDEIEVKVLNWSSSSLQNRWQRQIQRDINSFNAIYRSLKKQNPSGWNDDKFMEEATKEWVEKYGGPKKGFRFTRCLPEVWKCPRFDPVNDNNNDEGFNDVGNVMGASLPRPTGSKKTKTKIELEMIAHSQGKHRTDSMRFMSTATDEIAHTMAIQQLTESDMAMAKFYMQAGDQVEAGRYLAKIKQRQAEQEMRVNNNAERASANRRTSLDSSIGSTVAPQETAPVQAVQVVGNDGEGTLEAILTGTGGDKPNDDDNVSRTSSGHIKDARYYATHSVESTDSITDEVQQQEAV